MLFKRLNRNTAENIYISAENVEGATLTIGLPVAYALGASNDGVKVVRDDAALDHPGFIGVAVRDIPNNDFGLVQVGGFIPSLLVSNAGTSITITVGDPMIPAPAGFYSGAPTYANSGFKWVQLASNTPAAVSAASYVSGLMKLV